MKRGTTGAALRSIRMKRLQTAAICAVSAAALGLAGCQREPTDPEPATLETSAPEPSAGESADASPALAPPPVAPAAKPSAAPLDKGALQERRDPERVLRFYAAAIAARDWNAAARAWSPQSGVTAATLQAAYDRADAPRFVFGESQIEGAAGSLFYEAPTTVRFGAGGAPERGALILRRANDVDGATAEQLRWSIERSTIGAGQ